jgi:hypothetical protein
MPPWAMPRPLSLISYWMLRAVNLGRSPPWRFCLSRRRWRRRWRWFSWRRILAFPRNPPFGVALEKLVPLPTPQKAGGFRAFPILSEKSPRDYACSRTSARAGADGVVPSGFCDCWDNQLPRPVCRPAVEWELETLSCVRDGKDCHVGIWFTCRCVRRTRPSVDGFFESRQSQPAWARGVLSRGSRTISPSWYIRGGPHAAVSGVGAPRERQAFPEGLPLGDIRRSGRARPSRLGEVGLPGRC